MKNTNFTFHYRKAGIVGAWGSFVLGILYFAAAFIRPILIPSAAKSISDPLLEVMNVCIILMGPFLIASMVAIHAYAPKQLKVYSLLALIFSSLAVVLTTVNNNIMLNLSINQARTAIPPTWLEMFLPFQNPSISFSIDTMCWNWFYALAMLFGGFVFIGGGIERALRVIMLISGIMLVVALVILPFSEPVSDILSIIGYGILAEVTFFLLAKLFGRTIPMEQPQVGE